MVAPNNKSDSVANAENDNNIADAENDKETSFNFSMLLNAFIVEMNSDLAEIEKNLEQLAQSLGDMDTLKKMYRIAHKMKGTASMMDFLGLVHIAGGIEDILGDILDGLTTLDESIIGFLRRSLGRLHRLLKVIRVNIDEDAVIAEDDVDYARYLTKVRPSLMPSSSVKNESQSQDSAALSFEEVLASFRSPSGIQEKESPKDREITDFVEINVEPTKHNSIVRIRIIEEPLTAQNLTTVFSALTELSTKYWLIAKGRFADLIEYTQTHNGRFAEEAGMVITKITYNSPLNMDLKVDFSASSVAEALVITIDGITQTPKRLKQKELENQAKAQEIQHAEQQAAHEQQMVALEQEQRRLEIEKQRLEVLEKQLEVQKKGIEYALEIAGKVVDTLHPGADAATRAMEIQALLPNLVQLQNGKGLELALPVSQENQTPPKQSK